MGWKSSSLPYPSIRRNDDDDVYYPKERRPREEEEGEESYVVRKKLSDRLRGIVHDQDTYFTIEIRISLL